MLDSVRAIILKDKKILLVTGGEGKYWSPGGKQEPGETNKQTLERELKELSVGLATIELFHTTKISAFKEDDSTRYYYLCKINGELKAGSEITGFKWCGIKEFAEKYAKSNQNLATVIKMLHDRGKM